MTSAPSTSSPAPAWCLWRNPILRRFLRTRLRPRALGASLLIVLIIAGFIFAMARTLGKSQMETQAYYARAELAEGLPASPLQMTMDSVERMYLIPLLILQGFILFVVGTGQVAGGMTADADEGTMDYMRLSPMTPLAKVLGYLFGLPVREWLMFAVTLPFSAWGIWKGAVPASNWVPVYAVVLSAAVLYHLTGLTAGTVLRNRRWAFLVSMGGVFLLYTLIPQLAKLGLVYCEYLTIMPVVTENLSGFLPLSAGAALRTVQEFEADVSFFGLDFPEAIFTILSQLVLCLTFIVMLWRRWKKPESHLLGKAWASGLSVWIQIVLLGCALPLISPGLLFISRRFTMGEGRIYRNMGNWEPQLSEATAMIIIYGTVSLLGVILLSLLIAPARDSQITGLRRAQRLSSQRIPRFSDEAPSLPFVCFMSLAAAAGWTLFARGVIESHWFPGQFLPSWTPFVFGLVILTTSVCGALLYELRGAKGIFLALILAGVLPVLIGSVMAAAAREFSVASVWITSASPFMAPANAVTTALPDAIGNHTPMQVAGPRAFIFWQGLMVLAAIWLWRKHRAESHRRAEAGD